MNASSSPGLIPSAVCRRLLNAIRWRMLPEHELAYFQMLLTYFIDLDPAPEEFIDQLEAFIADARPGIAEAAHALLTTWQRSSTQEPSADLRLAEMLRILGALADEAEASLFTLEVTQDYARLRIFSPVLTRSLDAAELRQELAARVALRGQPVPDDPSRQHRYQWMLRAVGDQLAQQPHQPYRLVITPHLVVVEGREHHLSTLSTEQLAQLTHEAVQRRESPGPS